MTTDPLESLEEELERRRAGRRVVRGRRALEEFLVEVGRRLALPPRRAKVKPPAINAQPAVVREFVESLEADHAKWWQRRAWLPALAALVLVAWGASIIAGLSGPRRIPVAFRGTWMSETADFEGRRLILTDSTVQVLAGAHAIAFPAPVRTATLQSTPLGPQLTVVFAIEEGEDTLEVTLLAAGKLTLRHPADVVWDLVEAPRSATVAGAPAAAPAAAPAPAPAGDGRP